MDALSLGALNGLNAALTALLKGDNEANDPPAFSLRHVRMKVAGLGGFVAETRPPAAAGDILARRLDGVVAVTARGGDEATLQQSAMLILNNLLAADRVRRAQLGVHYLSLDKSGDPRPPGEGENQFAQDLFFKVRYEFIQMPQAPGDRINQVDVDIALEDDHEAFIITDN